MTIAYILLVLYAAVLLISVLAGIFILGRVYECCVHIRELDDKIDTLMSKGGGGEA